VNANLVRFSLGGAQCGLVFSLPAMFAFAQSSSFRQVAQVFANAPVSEGILDGDNHGLKGILPIFLDFDNCAKGADDWDVLPSVLRMPFTLAENLPPRLNASDSGVSA
jgi:hypothetical protein